MHLAIAETQKEKISLEKAKEFIFSQKNGAEAIFIGRVRNENSAKEVIAVTYDVYDEAAIKSFKLICNKAKNKSFLLFEDARAIIHQLKLNYGPLQ